MLKEQVRVGMKVMFGRVNGVKTQGVIEKINPSRAKVRQLDQQGSLGMRWMVPYSLIYPVEGESQAVVAGAVQVSMVEQRIEQLINRHGLNEVVEALNKITSRSKS
jgi:hypothetical protein